jgi:CHASE3 domain sensor protein
VSVRRATQLAAVLGVALVLVFGVFLWRESHAVATRVNDVRTVYDPSADQVALLDTALSDMQRGVSGFLIGAQEDDLQPYVNGSRRTALALQELRRLASR